MIDKTNRISGLGDIHFFIFQKNRGLLQTNVPDKFTRRNTRELFQPADGFIHVKSLHFCCKECL